MDDAEDAHIARKFPTGDDIRVVSLHHDAVPLLVRNPRESIRQGVYFLYALGVIGAGLALLSGDVPGFFKPAGACLGLCAAVSLSRLLLRPRDFYRPHYRYIINTLIGGAVIPLALLFLFSGYGLAAATGKIPDSGFFKDLVSRGYDGLFWIGLPGFVFVVMRTLRGWNNVRVPHRRPFLQAAPLHHLAEGWRMGVLLNGTILFFAAAFLVSPVEEPRIVALLIMAATLGYNLIALAFRFHRTDQLSIIHTLGSTAGGLSLFAFCGGLVYAENIVLSRINGTLPEPHPATGALSNIDGLLDRFGLYAASVPAALFLASRTLDMLGLTIYKGLESKRKKGKR